MYNRICDVIPEKKRFKNSSPSMCVAEMEAVPQLDWMQEEMEWRESAIYDLLSDKTNPPFPPFLLTWPEVPTQPRLFKREGYDGFLLQRATTHTMTALTACDDAQCQQDTSYPSQADTLDHEQVR